MNVIKYSSLRNFACIYLLIKFMSSCMHIDPVSDREDGIGLKRFPDVLLWFRLAMASLITLSL